MHLTVRVRPDVPSLRCPEVLERLRSLLDAARERGLRVVSFALMPNHIHILGLPKSAEALRDAMRYLLGQLARSLNKLFQRRGKVFEDRYWSTCATSVKQAFHALNYVLKNAATAGLRVLRGGLDAVFSREQRTSNFSAPTASCARCSAPAQTSGGPSCCGWPGAHSPSSRSPSGSSPDSPGCDAARAPETPDPRGGPHARAGHTIAGR
jgi:REP element-mobilizing transposase RayT